MTFRRPGDLFAVGVMMALTVTAMSAAQSQGRQAKPNPRMPGPISRKMPGPISKLKTAPPNQQVVESLRTQVYGFDDWVRAHRGAVPADARARVNRMQSLASRVKGEVRSYASRLKAANEVEPFDAALAARARQDGASADLAAAGGAYKVLVQGPTVIDDMIAARRKAAGTELPTWITSLTGTPVHASSTVCGLFWYVISAGYGTRFAYRSCYY